MDAKAEGGKLRWVRTWEPGPCMHAPRTPRRATSRAPSAPPRHIVRGSGPASATRGPTPATWLPPRPRARLHALAPLGASACMPRSTTASASTVSRACCSFASRQRGAAPAPLSDLPTCRRGVPATCALSLANYNGIAGKNYNGFTHECLEQAT
jgi:hypothetical protein